MPIRCYHCKTFIPRKLVPRTCKYCKTPCHPSKCRDNCPDHDGDDDDEDDAGDTDSDMDALEKKLEKTTPSEPVPDIKCSPCKANHACKLLSFDVSFDLPVPSGSSRFIYSIDDPHAEKGLWYLLLECKSGSKTWHVGLATSTDNPTTCGRLALDELILPFECTPISDPRNIADYSTISSHQTGRLKLTLFYEQPN
mgnify:CR=1 FL=1